MRSKLETKFKKQLGAKIGSYVLNSGREAFGIKMFENGFKLKRANRGEIVLDRFDLMCLKDLIISFEKKHEILDGLK